MKKVKRWRYYCDYCNKSGGSAHHMKKHELICTANPKRECGFCKVMEVDPKKEPLKQIVVNAVRELEAIQPWDSEKFDTLQEKVVKELLKESGGCPACVLAAIRQTEGSEFIQFDYKKAKKEFWDEWHVEPDYSYY
jgi:hypothetical protein